MGPRCKHFPCVMGSISPQLWTLEIICYQYLLPLFPGNRLRTGVSMQEGPKKDVPVPELRSTWDNELCLCYHIHLFFLLQAAKFGRVKSMAGRYAYCTVDIDHCTSLTLTRNAGLAEHASLCRKTTTIGPSGRNKDLLSSLKGEDNGFLR